MKKDSKFQSKINLTFQILAIIISVFALTISTCNDRKLEKINYKLSSIEYRPRLIISEPEIVKLNYIIDSIPVKKEINKDDSIADVFAKFDLELRLKITNSGNHTAKILGWAITDTLSDSPILKSILKESNRKRKISEDTIKFSYQLTEVRPNDFCFIRVRHTPQFIKENKYILHVMLFYENEIGQLFDTYYWLNLKTNEIVIPNPFIFENDSLKMSEFAKELFRIIETQQENNFSSIYSDKEKNKIIKRMKE